jgi:Ser/Thr protein kinase RdoA (MazF antagonist)
VSARADAALAAREAALPALGALLDPGAFAELLRAFAPEAQIVAARGRYVRYKPGARCVAAYRVELAEGEVLAHGIAHGPGAGEKLAKLRTRRAAASALGDGRFFREDLGLAIELFPNDARLRPLARLADPAFRDRLMARLRVVEKGQPLAELEALAYKPERRFVARATAGDGARAVVKIHTPADFHAAQAGHGYESRDALRLARCLRTSPRHSAVSYEWMEGDALDPLAAGADGALECAGAALAELHAQLPPSLEQSLEQESLASARLAAVLVPALAARAPRRPEEGTARLAASAHVPRSLHGDFHAGQLLTARGTTVLLDLDRACAGPAAQDVAVFAAHLELRAAHDGGGLRRTADAVARLLDGYARIAPAPGFDDVALHTAAALVSIAPQPFRTRDPEWPALLEALLDRAVAWLALAGGRCTDAVRAPTATALDAAMPFLAAALDPQRVAAPLARALDDATLRVESARIVRHKPARRALVEYAVRDGRGSSFAVLGKLRARGLDHAALRVQQALHERGFGANARDGVSVPETLGAVPELFLWLQRKAPGVPLSELLGTPGDAVLCVRVADALHKLHATPVETPRRFGAADEVAALADRFLPLVARTHPVLGARVDRLAEACFRVASEIPAEPLCGIHRDFHLDQVLVDDERLWLLDFDLYCEGHPALDAGNFSAHLTELALRRSGDAGALAHCEVAFEERFLALSGEVLRPALEAYTSLALVRHIALSTQYPDRRATTGALLGLCEERLGLVAAPQSAAR